MSEAKNEQGAFITFILAFLRMMCMSVEVFIRKNIGERYISLLHTVGIVVVYMTLMIFTVSITPAFDTLLMHIFFLSSLVLVLYHVIKARLRHREEVEIHSYYGGTPLPVEFIPIPENFFRIYLEPILILIIGVLLFFLGQTIDDLYFLYGFGIYLAFVGVLMFIKAQIEYHIQRNNYLDLLDKKIESDAISDVMKGKNPKDTKGFAIPGEKPRSEDTRQKLVDMYKGIDPSLLKMMEKSPSKDKEPNKVVERSNDKSKDIDMGK